MSKNYFLLPAIGVLALATPAMVLAADDGAEYRSESASDPAYAGIFAGTPFQDASAPVQRETLRRVQAKLTRFGFYEGQVDGLPGPATRAALLRYQASLDLRQTGRLDIATLGVLRLSGRSAPVEVEPQVPPVPPGPRRPHFAPGEGPDGGPDAGPASGPGIERPRRSENPDSGPGVERPRRPEGPASGPGVERVRRSEGPASGPGAERPRRPDGPETGPASGPDRKPPGRPRPDGPPGEMP